MANGIILPNHLEREQQAKRLQQRRNDAAMMQMVGFTTSWRLWNGAILRRRILAGEDTDDLREKIIRAVISGMMAPKPVGGVQ